jgi:NitT/TauT family transport system substrate-binding protein
MHTTQSRRDFLASLSAAGAASVLGARGSLAVEGPPETSALRLPLNSNLCLAPQFVAEEFLRAEGFTEVRYVPGTGGLTEPQMAGRGEIDFGTTTAAVLPFQLDAGATVTALAGVHSGCYELFAHEPLRTIGDLKGKRVGIQRLTSAGHLYLAIMAAYVGLDPKKDIAWVVPPPGRAMELRDAMEMFAEGKTDAFLGFPPEPQELRARGFNRVILSTALDKPWSQYFCCILYGSRQFVRDHPVATKRVLRAILKAANMCATDPERAARRLVDGGFTKRYDYALQTLTDLPYDRWREFDAEDSLRFYALRLHEVGMIKSTPNQIIAEGTDWRFLNELKRELKA